MRLILISIFIIIILILSTSTIFSQHDRLPVAILNLDISNIDESVAVTFSDRLRAELIKAGRFDVMERNRMEEILTEQGFQQTGACNSDECIVEAGRLLGVTQMISGSVGKVGSIFSITVRMIDVETGRILLTATDDSRGPIENVLTSSIPNVAKKLSDLAASSIHDLAGKGSLKLSSNPSGARIFIDDLTITGITPTIIDSITAGVHVIRMQKDLLSASQALFVAPNEETYLNLDLSLSKGALKIISEPDSADVFLDYNHKGITPLKVAELPVGAYQLKIVKPGLVDYSRIVTIKENETTLVTAKLMPMALLTVNSNPLDCQVIVDDSLIGVTPLTDYKIKPGYHRIEVGKKGFVSFKETRSIPAGQSAVLNITLDAVASLMINTEPPEAEVFINGIFRGKTPTTISDLPAGPATLKLQKEYYEDYFADLNLEKGMNTNVSFNLKKMKGKLIVRSIPAQATVEIDGIKVGSTPMEINDLDYGRHLLRVLKDGFKTYEQQLEIKDQLPELVRVNFEIAKGKLFLSPIPKDATIFLDGKRLREIPSSGVELLPGDYDIKATRPGYEKYKTTASLKPNEASPLTMQLVPKSRAKAVLRSVFLPGWGQKYAEKQTRRHLFFIFELTALTGVVISDLVYDENITEFKDFKEDYKFALSQENINRYRSKMENAYDDAKSAKNLRNNFAAIAAGIWAINILDSAIFGPIRPVVSTDQLSLNYTIKF